MHEPQPVLGGAPRAATSAEFAPRALVRALASILSSHGVLVLAGLGCLPLLARQLGPEAYGSCSLYSLLLAAVTYLDIARPTLVAQAEGLAPRSANGRLARARAAALSSSNTWLLALAAAAIGPCLLPPSMALALFAGALAHGLASRDWALLCLRGRVAQASAARNLGWAAATLVATGLVCLRRDPALYAWPFALANACAALLYRRWVGGHALPLLAPLRALRLAIRERGPALRDLLTFSLCSSCAVALDRSLLQRAADAADFGRYSAQADIALRLALFGTALGSVLAPLFAHAAASQGSAAADAAAWRAASWLAPTYALGLLALALCSRAITGIVLGPSYAHGPSWFAALLPGLYLQMFGFVITPLQRARGDFATQRRAYLIAAVLALAVGLVCIPRYGVLGAVLTYYATRSAELLLLLHELRRASQRGRSAARWRAATGLALGAGLCVLCWVLARPDGVLA